MSIDDDLAETGGRLYLKGNEAVAYGALHAGLNAYFAYPITPSSEVPETLAREFGKPDWPDFKVFMQSSSELEAINMTIGAAATGAKAMTFTASPGFSLKQEGISYAVGMEIPLLVGNVNRGGPGLGNIDPEQTDYAQCTRGGGHGGYKVVTLAPSTVQEIFSFPALAFDLAFKYRQPVIILSDAFSGQIKEDVLPPKVETNVYDTSWALAGAKDRPPNILNSLYLDTSLMEIHVEELKDKWDRIREQECLWEEYLVGDAKIVIVAYGIAARLALAAVNLARAEGIQVGLLRPKTIWPFPFERIGELTASAEQFLTVELNTGLMVEDVKLGVSGRRPVDLLYRVGGNMIPVAKIVDKIEQMNKEVK